MSVRRVGLALFAAGALFAVAAFGAGLTSSDQHLAAGTQAVARCDGSPAWSFSYGKNANGQVTSVTVSSISAACQNGSMSVTLTDGTNAASGGPSTIMSCPTSCSITFSSLSSALYPAQITTVKAVIVGP